MSTTTLIQNEASPTTDSNNKAATALSKATKKGTLAGLKHTDIQTVLEAMKSQISQALPKHLTPERIIQMSTTLITQNPKLSECSVQSLVGAVMQASILGFRPVEALGQCYFVPYKGHIQFQIGYKGYIDLARRSGQIQTIFAYVVRESDDFTYQLGLSPDLKHTPKSDPTEKITHVYAVAKYKDGGYNFVVLTRQEVEELRKRSPFQKAEQLDGAWKTDYANMAKAKAIKQLAKYLPLSDEMQSLFQEEEDLIDNDGNKAIIDMETGEIIND